LLHPNKADVQLMPAPRWLARFNLHVTNRILGPLALHMPGMGVIEHVGRKTHRLHRTPVLIFRQGNHYIIALTYGRESDWVKNVVAQNGCVLESQGRRLQLSNPYLYHDDKRLAMPEFVRAMLGLLNVSDFLELAVAGGAQAGYGKEGKHFENKKSA
jgi:deazaflavin-dependent oxidoreductase (nitroreductase family)